MGADAYLFLEFIHIPLILAECKSYDTSPYSRAGRTDVTAASLSRYPHERARAGLLEIRDKKVTLILCTVC